MTYREILALGKDIEIEHYEDIDFTPMSAVYVGCSCYHFEENEYGTVPLDKDAKYMDFL